MTPEDLRVTIRKGAIVILAIASLAFGYMWGHWF